MLKPVTYTNLLQLIFCFTLSMIVSIFILCPYEVFARFRLVTRIDISWLQAMDWIWPSKKGFIPIFVVISFAGLITYYFNSKYSREPFKAPLPQENYITRVKRILFFTSYFNMLDWSFGFGSEPFGQCPIKNSFLTNEGEPEDFDDILFHARNFKEQVLYI